MNSFRVKLEKVSFGQAWAFLGPIWDRFRHNDKFRSRPIQSTYYALTFSEKIRKNKQADSEIIRFFQNSDAESDRF